MRILTLLLMVTTCLHAEAVTRGAIDIGSGAMKLEVASVDTNSGEIVETLYRERAQVAFQADLQRHPENGFSDKVISSGTAALIHLVEAAEEHGASNIVAIATAAFRNAPNGIEAATYMAEEAEITIHIIPQTVEGQLAYAAGSATMQTDDIVVWDAGRASFQIASAHGVILGMISLDQVLDHLQAGEDVDQTVEWIQRRLPHAPDWMKRRVHALGNGIFKSATSESHLLSLGEAKQAIERLELRDDEWAYPGLVLTVAVMDHYDIETIVRAQANGTTTGLLVTDRFWIN